MIFRASRRHSLAMSLAFGVATVLAGCGSKQEPAAPTPAAAPAPATAAAPAEAPAAAPAPVTAADVATQTWTPEALEELLAPIALYPDPVLSQVLIAATNPQEVLDAGNWLIANEGLEGKALDEGAAQAGFTPPIRALVQFPQTIDMMCMEMGWTTELGQAFVADQAGVLGAVQRLRRQAMDVGNLKSSEAMLVETQQQEGQEVVVLKPPKPEVVYVPQYDPQAVYAPAPATVPQTTTVTPVETDKKYTTGNMVTTGLLAFGAGILVNEIFDDDDDDYRHGYYYPNYGYGGMPYYPPYPYRPAYGNGYYPSNGYRPPPGYGGGFHNSGNIIVTNPGGGRGDNGYWDRYDNNRAGGVNRNDRYKSPISSAKPNRPELADLNNRQARPMPANVQRPNKDAAPRQYKGSQNYAGAKDGGYKGAAKGAAGTAAANRPDARPTPKVQGSYKGAPTGGSKVADSGYKGAAKDMAKPASRPAQAPAANRPNTGNVKPPSSGGGDRGYSKPTSKPASMPKPQSAPRPESRPAQMPANRSPQNAGSGARPQKPSAMSGSGGGGKADKAASQRGKQSMPQGARSKGGGGGGGGKKGKR
jgi:hypothetical protein